jgi:hypothetical protein
MRIIRASITCIFIVLLLLDLYWIAKVIINGLPQDVYLRKEGQVLIMESRDAPITFIGILIAIGYAAIHGVFISLMWRLWKQKIGKGVAQK